MTVSRHFQDYCICGPCNRSMMLSNLCQFVVRVSLLVCYYQFWQLQSAEKRGNKVPRHEGSGQGCGGYHCARAVFFTNRLSVHIQVCVYTRVQYMCIHHLGDVIQSHHERCFFHLMSTK